MKKFGPVLNSRPDGREAALGLFQIVNGTDEKEIVLDFADVVVLTPSFADEFLSDVYERYADQKEIRLTNTDSSSVKEALKVLEKNN